MEWGKSFDSGLGESSNGDPVGDPVREQVDDQVGEKVGNEMSEKMRCLVDEQMSSLVCGWACGRGNGSVGDLDLYWVELVLRW